MPASLPFGVSCRGGLNTNLNQFEMLSQPGLATDLENFEVDSDGGYRRINGFDVFGGSSSARPNGNSPILGLFVYADGLIATSGTNVYFTLDGVTWLQINRASVHSSGDNYSTFVGRSAAARTSQGQCTFALYEGDSDYGELVITDEASSAKPFYFKMTGAGALTNRTYFAKEITVSGSVYPTVATMHDRHLVVSGDTNNPNTIYYSHTDAPDDFGGSGAGSIKLDDKVIGLRPFRADLIIFCKNSIYKLVNINDSNNIAIQPVTKNVGCLDNHSIQEIAGDLVFLSPDGVRTIAGTARIGDVELGSVSRQIQSIIETIAKNIDGLIIDSVVLRQKSQYRVFYTTGTQSAADSKGIIGSLTSNGFEWSETKGIQARAITSGFNFNGIEQTFHGDSQGYVYIHDTGSYFLHDNAEAAIRATYKTPNYDFGDFGTRKNMRYVKISISPEGTAQPTLRVRYDYEDTNIPQPTDYTLLSVPLPAIFGESSFGAGAVFGATNDPMVRQAIQGGGYTASFRLRSEDKNPPYAINGMYLDYVPSTRR